MSFTCFFSPSKKVIFITNIINKVADAAEKEAEA